LLSLAGFAILNHPVAGLVAPVSPIVFQSGVAGAPSSERNFHIFYYLFAGAAAKERQHMQLPEKMMFRYLALKNVGFSKRHVAQTCQLIAAILHLGNLEFTVDQERDVNAAIVRNQYVLALVAEFLGITPSALETVLLYSLP
jgi:chitin synthase